MKRFIGRMTALIIAAAAAASAFRLPAYAANFRIVMAQAASEHTLALVEEAEDAEESSAAEEAGDTAYEETLQAYEDALLAMEGLSFYQKLSLSADVSILIIGDSIGTGSGASDEDDMWFNLLSDYLQEVYYAGESGHITMTNLSMGGNDSYAGYVTSMAFEDGVDYDLILLCSGQNDSDAEFALYYEAMIRALKSKYVNASLISILESSQCDYTEKILDTIELCEYYGIAMVDTIAAFVDSGYSYEELTADGVHPSSLGQSLYALYAESVIDANVAAGTGIVSMPKAYDNEVNQYDEFIYYAAGTDLSDGISQFVRTDETTYTLRVAIKGTIGIHYSYSIGDSVPDIYIDGEQCTKPVVICEYDFTEGLIQVIGKNCTVKQEITVIFENAEQADGFLGMCFSW